MVSGFGSYVSSAASLAPGYPGAARLYYFLGLDIEDALADFGVVVVPREHREEMRPKEAVTQ